MRAIRRVIRWFANSAREECGLTLALENYAGPTQDGWVTVATVGDHQHKPSGKLQRVRPEDLDEVLEDIENARKRQGANWRGIPFHCDPAHPADNDGPAIAWAKEWRVFENALQCMPDWNAVGRTRILENKEFKQPSVKWDCWQDQKDGSWHPCHVIHVGMTNNANMQDITPVVNSAAAPAGSQPAERDSVPLRTSPDGGEAHAPATGSAAPVANTSTPTPAGQPARACIEGYGETRLPGGVAGAEPQADPAIALAAEVGRLTALVNSQTERVAGLERDLAAVRTELATEREVANSALVDRFIALRRINPAKRAAALAIIANNRSDALAVWEQRPGAAPVLPPAAPADPLAGVALANAGVTVGASARRATADECQAIANAAQALYAKGRDSGLTYDQAHSQAWQAWENGKLAEIGNSGR